MAKRALLEVRCAARQLLIEWHFDGNSSRADRLRFDGKAAALAEVDKIIYWVRDIGAEVFARAECGARGAVIEFIEADRAGAPHARQIRFDWFDGVATAIRRVGFE